MEIYGSSNKTTVTSALTRKDEVDGGHFSYFLEGFTLNDRK